MKKLSLHILQFPSQYPEPLKTLKNLEKLISGLKIKRGHWLILPEMWPGSFNTKARDLQRMENAFCFHRLKQWAQKYSCYVVGSMLEMPRNLAYNTAFVMGPQGTLLGTYRKKNLFKHGGEHRQYQPGKSLQVLPWQGHPLGLAICYDLRFPEEFRRMVRRGARWFIIPSAWPLKRMDHFKTLCMARALENQCFLIAANKCGPEKGGMVLGGQSMVINPWGEIVAKLGSRSGILSVEIDLDKISQIRRQYPFLPEGIK